MGVPVSSMTTPMMEASCSAAMGIMASSFSAAAVVELMSMPGRHALIASASIAGLFVSTQTGVSTACWTVSIIQHMSAPLEEAAPRFTSR